MNVVISIMPSKSIPNNDLSPKEFVEQELDFMNKSQDVFDKFNVKLITDNDLSSAIGLAELALSDCSEWTEKQIKDRCKSIQTHMLTLWKETKHEK